MSRQREFVNAATEAEQKPGKDQHHKVAMLPDTFSGGCLHCEGE